MIDFRQAHILRQWVEVLLNGPFDAPSMALRVSAAFKRKPRWLRPLCLALVTKFGEGARPHSAAVRRSLLSNPAFRAALRKGKLMLPPGGLDARQMTPGRGRPSTWQIPPVVNVAELGAWLNLSLGDLAWFANIHSDHQQVEERLQHYRVRWIPKRSGGGRLLEVPKLRLKLIQGRILNQILNLMEPHEAAHGFRRGHSVKDYVAGHLGRPVVLRMDLRDFFPSIRWARVESIFRYAGYPEAVASLLAGLCTTATRGLALIQGAASLTNGPQWPRLRELYAAPHLPQGAPTSPALANLAAFRLDCRLAGLARSAGAHYTRYADDLLFSGEVDLARGSERFLTRAGAIILEEGFEPHFRKTRVMRQSIRQHAAGAVLNSHMNLPREEWDRLEAILHNAVRFGLESQNREHRPEFFSHLAGRVAHAANVNLRKAGRLKTLLQQLTLTQNGEFGN